MTRFARSKGSKASNEKTPEDGTPWEVMKEQLLKAKKESDESKKRQEAEKQRVENYENFLKEQKIQKRKATWCDFPEVEKNNTISNSYQPPRKKNKSKNNANFVLTNNNVIETAKNINSTEKTDMSEKTPSKKSKNKTSQSDVSILSVQLPLQTTKKLKKNKKNHVFDNSSSDNKDQTKSANMSKGNVKQKNTQLQILQNADETVNNKKKKKNKKSKQINAIEDTQGKSVAPKDSERNKEFLEGENLCKKNKKSFDGKPVRRKVVNDRSFQLIVNGKEIELVRVDGFPIMKKDAERLEELKNNMIKKGIPKSEVQRTMKLERRKAEKALARLKREVCYNCRKGGHNLSDCPDLKSKIPGVQAAEGICFKCGSTEHRQFECKVQRDKEFRFATCFICKESGHIARQCPDNPKGLYPNGGCCKLCGDVTHLKKDCLTLNTKKESTSIKLKTLDNMDNIEDVDQSITTTMQEESVKKPKKIKF